MNWEMIGAIGETLGALGVLASLIYLGTQIRGNTRSLQAASLQSVLDGPRDRFFQPMMASKEISQIFTKGLTSPDLLDDNEKVRFFFILQEHCFQMHQVMQLYERGLLKRVDYEPWLKWVTALLRSPGGAVMWSDLSAMITPTVAKLINEQLDQYPDDPSVLETMPIFKYNG